MQWDEKLTAAQKALQVQREQKIQAEAINADLQALADRVQEKAGLDARAESVSQVESRLSRQKLATLTVKPVYDAWQQETRQVSGIQTSMTQTETEVESQKEAAQKAENAVIALESNETAAGELEQKAAVIEKSKESYQKRDEALKALKANTELQDSLTAQQGELSTREKELRDKAESCKQETAALAKVPEALIACGNDIANQSARNGKMQRVLEEIVPAWEDLVTDVREKQTIFTQKSLDYCEKEEVRHQAEMELERSRAGILAQSLEETKPCPVCGSVHHPSPARLLPSSMTDAAYKKLQKAAESARKEKENADRDSELARSAEQTVQASLKKEILDLLQTAAEDVSLNALIPALKARLADEMEKLRALQQRQTQLTEDKTRMETLQASLKKIQEEELPAAAKDKESLAEQLVKVQKALAAAEAALDGCSALEYADWAAAERAVKTFRKDAKALRDAYREAVKDRDTENQKLSGLKGRLQQLLSNLKDARKAEAEKQEAFRKALSQAELENEAAFRELVTTQKALDETAKQIQDYHTAVKTNAARLRDAEEKAAGKTWVNMDALNAALEEQAQTVSDLNSITDLLKLRVKTNRNALDKIRGQLPDLEKWQQEFSLCEDLYQRISGGRTGTNKITLEQYIQASGFDRIIQSANRRLLPMSSGQYELRRQTGSTDKRSKTFLDLEVLDYHTGKSRSVGDLSGGESFKASLSLALGLADTVSISHGGIQMDALFIDEGFGTLDSNSIESAMEILFSLSGRNAHKLVGIISHREELQRIPQKIQVTKDKKTGSSIEIITEG